MARPPMVTHLKQPCGCGLDLRGQSWEGAVETGRIEIVYCSLHAAAATLLDTLKALLPPDGEDGVGEWWGLDEQQRNERLRAILHKIDG